MGASKLVIMPKDEQYVIKIPFSGDAYKDRNGVVEVIQFCCAPTENKWDYCQAEAERFIEADAADLGRYFAKTELIGFISNYPIYWQERAEIMDNYWYDHSDIEREVISKKSEEINQNCFCPNWLIDFYNFYGEDEFIRFMNYIGDNRIGDLYEANLGYIDGKPVLVDYSDFLE